MPKRVHETMSKQSKVESREDIPGRQTAKIPQGKKKKKKGKNRSFSGREFLIFFLFFSFLFDSVLLCNRKGK